MDPEVGTPRSIKNVFSLSLPPACSDRTIEHPADHDNSFASLWRKVFQHLNPLTCMSLICLSVHESIVIERTKETCTPRPRCCPLHSRHINTPYDTLAHCGFGAEQSTHNCPQPVARVQIIIRFGTIAHRNGRLYDSIHLPALPCYQGGHEVVAPQRHP